MGTLFSCIDLVHQAVGVDVIVEGPHLDVAGRKNEVRSVDGIDHVHGAQLPGESNLYGSTYTITCRYLPPKGGGISAPFTAPANLVADLELGQVVQLGFGESFALHGQQAHRQAGGVELQHHRRQGSRRQSLQVGQRQVGNLA